MQIVTKEQIYERWEQVPEALKEAFFSVENGEIIWKTCEDLGLSEEVTNAVSIVVGNVLFGFIHINDLAKELQSMQGMDQKAIDPIIFQVDKRIFEPVKGEILKLYRTVSGAEPKIIAEEKITSGEISDQPKMINDSPQLGVPVDVESAQLEIRKVRIEGAGDPKTKTENQPIEAPSIIHSEVELRPVAQKKRAMSSFGGLFGFRQGGAAQKEGPAVAAQVSMIEGVGKRPDEVARTEQQAVRVVHYTDIKAPEDMFGNVPKIEATSAVPVSKQEHDFEPTVVNLADHPATKDLVLSRPELAEGNPPKDMFNQGEAIPASQPQEMMAASKPIAENRTPETPINVQAQTMNVEEQRVEIIQPVAQSPQSAIPTEGSRPEPAEGAIPFTPQIEVMKTPQRPEAVDGVRRQEPEPRLTEIPVADDIVDLRMLERVSDKK